MNNFIQSRLFGPVARQARRFSGTSVADNSDDGSVVEVSNPNCQAPIPVIENPIASAGTEAAITSHGSDDATDHPQTPPAEESAIPQELLSDDLPTAADQPSQIRDPVIARQNGFQGLIPLDDLRSNYVYDSPPVLSPGEEISRPPLTSMSRTIDSLSEMSLDDGPRMSSNPSIAMSGRYQSHPGSIYSNMSRSSAEGTRRASHAHAAQSQDSGPATGSPMMSGALPADDGMRLLREQLHQVRDMALSSEEKAKKMHELMVSDYVALQQSKLSASQQDGYLGTDPRLTPGTSVDGASHRSMSPSGRFDDLIITTEDLRPTYRPRSPAVEGQDQRQPSSPNDEDEEERPLGCKHYTRNIKVNCPDCQRWYTCRHCHDELESHPLDRKALRNMLCMLCGHPQPAGEYCSNCGMSAAAYYCGICKLWDSDPRRKIYHCPDCGICRRGEGLGKDYVHCKVRGAPSPN